MPIDSSLNAPGSDRSPCGTSSDATAPANPDASVRDEFATVDAVILTAAETHAVDAFALSIIKHERQLRRLLTYSIFQFPCFHCTDIADLRHALASNTRVYADGFVPGIDRLWPKSVSTIVGARYAPLMQSLVRSADVRNKIFHGQVTKVGIERPTLLALVSDIREWCGLLATAAQNEVGYDGFARDSYRKSTIPDLHLRFAQQLKSIADYKQFIARYVARS